MTVQPVETVKDHEVAGGIYAKHPAGVIACSSAPPGHAVEVAAGLEERSGGIGAVVFTPDKRVDGAENSGRDTKHSSAPRWRGASISGGPVEVAIASFDQGVGLAAAREG